MLQFQNEFITIELANNSTVIVLTWKGYIPSPSYREAMEKALEIARERRIENWISDIRLAKVLGIKDQEWCSKDWIPRAASAGCYRKQAVIMSEDVFGQATADKIISRVENQQIEFRNFTKLEDAKEWLAGNRDYNNERVLSKGTLSILPFLETLFQRKEKK
jgi:hypothetical protein